MSGPQIVPLWPDGSPNNTVADADMPAGRPCVELYVPPTWQPVDKPRACVLICPGGGYTLRARHEGEPFAWLFAQAGMFAGVVHYRVQPNRHPAPFADAARAVRLVRSRADEWKIDPARIGLMGFSAGGHLAATVGIQSDLVRDEQDDLAATVSARPNRIVWATPSSAWCTSTMKARLAACWARRTVRP